MEKVKEVVHKVTHPTEHSSTHPSTTHTTGTHTTGTHTTGTHTGTHTGAHSGATGSQNTAGPHNSDLLNRADPRVDSDMDGSRNMGAAKYGPGGHSTGTTSTMAGSHNTAGPHSSDTANRVDPRVDSDMDGSRNMGASQYGPGGHQNTGTGLGSTSTGYGSGSTRTGPHSSGMANAADPRVDSDMDGSRNMGAANYGPGGHQTGTTGGLTGGTTSGYNTGSTRTGPHSSGLANAADPRVDSDRDGSRNMGAANYGPGGHQHTGTGTGFTSGTGTTGLTSGPGPAPNTAGPHQKDYMNVLDPRVDSDRDGSKTVGGGSSTTY